MLGITSKWETLKKPKARKQTISPLVDLTLKPQQETQICSFRVEKD